MNCFDCTMDKGLLLGMSGGKLIKPHYKVYHIAGITILTPANDVAIDIAKLHGFEDDFLVVVQQGKPTLIVNQPKFNSVDPVWL